MNSYMRSHEAWEQEILIIQVGKADNPLPFLNGVLLQVSAPSDNSVPWQQRKSQPTASCRMQLGTA